MTGTYIEGGVPLMGTVTVSGSKNSASKLIYASMFSNEDIVLSNAPRVLAVLQDIEVIESVGGKAEWLGTNTLLLNGSQINTHEIPFDIGSKYRTSLLLAGPLLFRFGKVKIPKYISKDGKEIRINRFLDSWVTLGFKIEEDGEYIKIVNDGSAVGAHINFKIPSHTATDNLILSSVFIPGETTVSNSSEEYEIEDLIELLNKMGAQIEKTETGKLKIMGVSIFKDASHEVCSDKSEIATFASLAVLTKGSVSIKNVNRDSVLQFINFLNKIGIRFEFSENELRVWRHNEVLQPLNIEISPTPGFVPDWQSLAVLILTQADGESTIHDTVYINRFGYCMDLNRMGARIDLLTPSEAGLTPIISDDSYSLENSGEPKTVAKVSGPTRLRGERISIDDFSHGPVLVLAALSAEGKSEIIGIENANYYFEDFIDKLTSLGAKIWEQSD